MKRTAIGLLLGLAGVLSLSTDTGGHGFFFWNDHPRRFPFQHHNGETSFQRVATLGNYLNNGADAADETVSEIIAATANGRLLVYTDAIRGAIGFIGITNPSNPTPLGTLPLDSDPTDAVDHSPTSVDILGNNYALVAVDTTSGEFDNPSGYLLVVDISNPATPVAAAPPIDLHGQPDSLTISPDGRFAAIAIENQRNEDLCVGGTLDGTEADEEDCIAGGGALGVLPQAPAGNLTVIRLVGPPAAWMPQEVDLTGLAHYAPDDPEPEFVDVNDRNEAVVTLQENNHIVVVDLATRTVQRHFRAGAVTLNGVDTSEDGVISLTDVLPNVLREPDAVAWVPGRQGTYRIATANEGDLFGGSRGFSLFRENGTVVFDSGTSLDALAVRHGHYPEGRSDAKGTEPEAIVYARFGSEDYLFVGAERGSFIAVYTLDRFGRPQFEQLLPGPLGPEGLLAIPERNLLVVAGETDLEGVAVRSTVMIYQLKRGEPAYPEILSDDEDGSPIPWSALSGMTSIPWRDHSLLAVWDAAYSTSYVFKIDVSARPAVITDRLEIKLGAIGTGNYDPEGIAVAPDGFLWVASEGNASDSSPNRLIKLDPNGTVVDEIGLPKNIVDCRAATVGAVPRRTLGSGFEGIAVLPGHGSRFVLAIAQQRGWNYTTPDCEDLDDDAGGFNALGEPNWTRIWIYDPTAETWSFVPWELAPLPPNAAWVGLSEITQVPGGDLILVERDNLTGDFAALKTLVKVDGRSASGGFRNGEKATFDLLPRLLATNGWISDKVEGVAVTRGGRTYVSTDNDGLDDWSGETSFFGLGRFWELFN
jgi:hypothetical protein